MVSSKKKEHAYATRHIAEDSRAGSYYELAPKGNLEIVVRLKGKIQMGEREELLDDSPTDEQIG